MSEEIVGGFDKMFSWMNHQLDLLIWKMMINKQFTSNTNQHNITTREKPISWKNAVVQKL